MSLIVLPDPGCLRMSSVSSRTFGQDNWGKVGGADLVLEGPDVGAGPPFADSDIARSFRQVFVEGRPWRETAFFQKAARRIAAGTVLWRCTTPEQLEARLEGDIRALHRSMQENGFLSQQEIAARLGAGAGGALRQLTGPGYHAGVHPGHNVKVGITEGGEVLFLDGRHRVALALTLGLRDLPVRVVFRHARWHALRQGLAALGPGRITFAHPDLQGLSAGDAPLAPILAGLDPDVRDRLGMRGA